MKHFSFLIYLYTFINFTNQKNYKKNTITSTTLDDSHVKKTKHTSLNYKKFCTVKENCKECTFEELKTIQECQNTGYKILKLCTVKDNDQIIEENLFNESCLESKKISSIYIMLILSIIVVIVSGYVRKSRKRFRLHNTLEKLTILTEKDRNNKINKN